MIINEKNAERIEAMLADEQKRARVRLMTFEQLQEGLRAVETALYPLPKSQHTGILAEIRTNSLPVAKSYRGTPEETVVIVLRRPSGWAVYRVERRPMVPNRSYDAIELSFRQAQELLHRELAERKIYVGVDK